MAINQKFVRRRLVAKLTAVILAGFLVLTNQAFWQSKPKIQIDKQRALHQLSQLEVKGRAPKTGYSREQFGKGWAKDSSGCDMRNRILKRDLQETIEQDCKIFSGKLNDPYTGKTIIFNRSTNASAVQIDHVVALSDAWQKGAQQLDFKRRVQFANDPLNLLASEGQANQEKGDADAASWLPLNKVFRCQYIERQVQIKFNYSLWITPAEKDAMQNILLNC